MTLTTESPNVAGALEGIASHLHPSGSFDLADHPVPSGREEIWRFTPLRRLRGVHESAELTGGVDSVEVSAAPGVFAESVPTDHPARGSSGMKPRDRVSARAWAAAQSVFLVDIPADLEAESVTRITLTGTGAQEASAGHLVIRAGQFSKATVVVRFEGSAAVTDNVEIIVGDGANLSVVVIDDWADDALHVAAQHALVGRDARLKHVAVSFGGDLVRSSTSVEYAGSGGEAELLGLYFADAGQHLEHRLFVDHNEPRTKSHVDYRGALQGAKAHTVWIGDVLIRKEAEGIDTYESNKNLLLTSGCQADSVPNLEIETGEIEGAGHSSTTGRFDDQQLFYLRSRGIDEAEARRLVVHGFFADIIRRIGDQASEAGLLATLESELARTVGVPELTPVESSAADPQPSNETSTNLTPTITNDQEA